ncbi:amidase [Bdellovibrio bacteriovorus]|uniref:Amidase n=1 Tax=Bdellovibrio bacteriovorus TaxID=959 RepID=A0A162GDP1_BDEBC|nr:amidase [Bdellovibrio bacteriovorus]KYG67900.1 amidase [Bdellovibrio bacteriovorus]
MNELLKLSATEIAAKVARREVTPSEVLEAHIARIEAVNPSLNAMVEKDFERARKLAKEQDERVAKDNTNLPVFFGVPFTVKEMFAYKGMKRTGGSIHKKELILDWDATVVERMKNAGAIPMGSTNVPELGFWFETFNPVYGRTNNPYDVTRTCGGSSGGEGALLGAGASPMGLGSDIGGSIRMPAFFCGVSGHKPSRKLVPLTGHFPFERDELLGLSEEKYPYTSMGPMSRKASDLYPMLKVMMGADGRDPHTMEKPVLEERTQEWAGRKILICPEPIFHRTRSTDYELAQVVRNCGRLFSELGADVQELDPRFFVHATSLWFSALKSSKNRHLYETLMGPEKDFSIGKELLKVALGRGDYTFPNLLVSLGEKLNIGGEDFAEDMQALAKMKADLDEMLGEEGLLLLPPHPRVAPKHRAPLWSPFDFIYTAIFVTTGHPATVTPTGLNSEGLPLGIQIVAGHMKDHLTLSCAEFIETTFGGWQPPK